jgi:excisionase family DNA binding protein
MSEEGLEKHYTVTELARILSVKPYTVRRWIREETITAVRLPGGRGDYRISETEAKRLVNNTYGSGK